jgi:hypothetical protein
VSDTITRAQLFDLVDQLRKTDWLAMRARLLEALRRAGSAGAHPDGFSSGSGTGRGSGTPDPTFSHANARGLHDPIREHALVALRALDNGVAELLTVQSRLRLIDHLVDVSELNPEPGCSAMAKVGGWEPVHVTTDLGGRLPEAVPLGRWAYDFARATGRLPTRQECQAHRDGKRVRVKLTAESPVVVIGP